MAKSYKDAGLLPEDADVDAMARAMIALVQGFAAQMAIFGDIPPQVLAEGTRALMATGRTASPPEPGGVRAGPRHPAASPPLSREGRRASTAAGRAASRGLNREHTGLDADMPRRSRCLSREVRRPGGRRTVPPPVPGPGTGRRAVNVLETPPG